MDHHKLIEGEYVYDLIHSTAFIVRHFSDTVEYTCNGFLEKNRDTISKELVNVLRQSELSICRLLMALDDRADGKSKKTALDGRVVISASKQLVFFFNFLTFD